MVPINLRFCWIQLKSYPHHPCMIYLPTFGWCLWWMQRNILFAWMVWDTRGIFIIHEPTVFFCEFLHETDASQLVLLGEEWQQKAADANRQVTWQRFSSNSVGAFCIMLWYNLFAQLEGNMGILMEVVRILVIKLSSHRSLWTHLKKSTKPAWFSQPGVDPKGWSKANKMEVSFK